MVCRCNDLGKEVLLVAVVEVLKMGHGLVIEVAGVTVLGGNSIDFLLARVLAPKLAPVLAEYQIEKVICRAFEMRSSSSALPLSASFPLQCKRIDRISKALIIYILWSCI